MFDINNVTTVLEENARNGRLTETQYETRYTIAYATISGTDLMENLTAISTFWEEKASTGFGVFNHFNTYDISCSGMIARLNDLTERTIDTTTEYSICITAYYRLSGEKGIYQAFVIPSSSEEFNKWVNQPVYDHEKTFYQYTIEIEKWEHENVDRQVVIDTHNAIERYSSDGDYYGLVVECGYTDGTYGYKTYEDWLIEDFFKIA